MCISTSAASRRATALIEEFGVNQLPETLLQYTLGNRGKARDHLVGEFTPKHRAELRKFANLRKRVESRHQ